MKIHHAQARAGAGHNSVAGAVVAACTGSRQRGRQPPLHMGACRGLACSIAHFLPTDRGARARAARPAAPGRVRRPGLALADHVGPSLQALMGGPAAPPRCCRRRAGRSAPVPAPACSLQSAATKASPCLPPCLSFFQVWRRPGGGRRGGLWGRPGGARGGPGAPSCMPPQTAHAGRLPCLPQLAATALRRAPPRLPAAAAGRGGRRRRRGARHVQRHRRGGGGGGLPRC